MTPSERIDRYVDLFRLRLQMLTSSRGAALIAAAALVISLSAVAIAIRNGFDADFMLAARLLLLASLAALFAYCIALPNRRIKRDAVSDIERRAPFGGRIETYLGMRDANNPMRELLAEDALRIADSHAPEGIIPQREFTWALGTASVCLSALLLLALAGPGNYAYGVRHLWVGWAFPGVLPPQSISVTPGDDGIRAGGTVRVNAQTQGFSPREAFVHARFGDDEWQSVSMADLDGEFEFTFFSVREPLEYYVSAAGVRSQTYTIKVVDLPNIERLITTYRFPEWTGRDPEVRDPGGDVRAIADTQVDIEIRSSDTLPDTVLVVDDEEVPLETVGGTGSGSFAVQADGQYYVAARVGGERIRLSDDYFISVLDDEAPEIEFARPGRDWSASSIEEVTAEIVAKDDFRLESLALHYSVNGGEWQSVELEAGAPSAEVAHVFFLESIQKQSAEGSQGVAPLLPGDLISYYATANDREQSASTDIFFVDVQPFDKRYSQSQMAGGGGGQQGGVGDEISQRQREIIVSTWNLIREAREGKRGDASYVPNNAALLARLQTTLKDQAETLAARTRARQLTASDDKIAEFVASLDAAAAAMVPAAQRLAAIELDQAILPEQEALQHLLRAEAVFTDISVSMQANNRSGGGGGRAGRDLTNMFELEMDLEKNQYETGSRATPDAPEQQLDEFGDQLDELARRQEQLAERLERNPTTSPAERWQQDALKRELEDLLERFEQAQQAANTQQNASSSQQQSGSSKQTTSESGEPQGADSDTPAERRTDQLRRRMDSALRAMNDAETAMREGADRDALRRAAEEAQRQLEGARDQAAADREGLMRESLANLGERADGLYERQTGIEQRLEEAIRRALEDAENDNRLDSGMSFLEEQTMARDKRELKSDLERLEQDVAQTAQTLRESEPEAATELETALERLREERVDERLGYSATYIEQGDAVYVAASESAITESLEDLVDSIRRAGDLSDAPNAPEDGANQPSLARTLAQTQSLRRQLQAMNDGANRSGPVTDRGRDDLQQSTGVRVPDLETTRDFDRDLDNISDDVLNLFRDLRSNGVPEGAIDELRRLAGEVRASDFSGNEALLARESQLALNLVEQLELALADAARAKRASVRATPTDEVPDEHRAPVANYYRRLGEDRKPEGDR